MLTLRPSRDDDLPAVCAIYAHHVLHGTGTFETEPPGLADMAARRADVLAKRLPYLVAEQEGRLLGFAYCNWFKPRPAYRFSAEDSIYLADGAQGRGIGAQLLAALCRAAEAAGVRKLIAVISLAVSSTHDWYSLGYLLGLYGLIAVLEGLVIGPYVLHRSTRVPWWAAMLGPIVLGIVIPFWGVLLAPPLLAIAFAFRKPAPPPRI